MSINFSTKKVKFPGALKAYAESQLQGIGKIAGDIIDADVMISEGKINYKVEISLKTRLSSLHGQGDNRILKQALRDALAAIKIQAKKNKEKIKVEKKRVGKKPLSGSIVAQQEREIRRSLRREEKEQVLLSDNFSRKPLTVEEAIFFLKDSDENSYMFLNAETNRLATVFWNRQGSISLIEPSI